MVCCTCSGTSLWDLVLVDVSMGTVAMRMFACESLVTLLLGVAGGTIGAKRKLTKRHSLVN